MKRKVYRLHCMNHKRADAILPYNWERVRKYLNIFNNMGFTFLITEEFYNETKSI